MINTGPLIIVGVALLLTAAAPVLADDSVPGTKAAPRVLEMLQKKQENLLREQLARDGRWDEVQKLDAERARRQREQQSQVVARMNDELARNGKSDAPANSALVDPCDK